MHYKTWLAETALDMDGTERRVCSDSLASCRVRDNTTMKTKYTRRRKKLMSWVHMKKKQAEHRRSDELMRAVRSVLEANGGLYARVGETFDYRNIRPRGGSIDRISNGQLIELKTANRRN